MSTEFLVTKEVAKILRGTDRWVKRLVTKSLIPSYKIGGKRLYKKEDIMRWIDSYKEEPRNSFC